MRERLVKVVRDKVPSYLPDDRTDVEYREITDQKTFWDELRKKLGEELAEYLIGGDPRELADLGAVVEAVAWHVHGLDHEAFQDLVDDKGDRMGRFETRMGMFVMTLEEERS